MSRLDLLMISKNPDVNKRAQSVASVNQYEVKICQNLDEVMSQESLIASIPVIAIYCGDIADENEIVGSVQVIRQIALEAKIIVIVDGKMTPESSVFIKKSGADCVFLETEFNNSSKFEYVLGQTLRANYMPIKAVDLAVDTKIEFNIYHLMPLNKKYLLIIPNGQELTQTKYDKIAQIGDVYIKRSDILEYEAYVKKHQEKLNQGVKSRCRAQFLALTRHYSDLVMLITDQSQYTSFEEGKRLALLCQELANDLVTSLGSVEDAWDIITNAAEGEFGSVERSPAIAAYAGLIGFSLSLNSIGDMMIGALLSNIGLLDLPSKITSGLSSSDSPPLHPEDLANYQNHPVVSLNRVLSRKIPISELCKSIILTTHERFDQKGFPNRVRPEKIPIESLIIQICEKLDKLSVTKMGEKRKTPAETRLELLKFCQADSGWLPLLFVEKVKPILNH